MSLCDADFISLVSDLEVHHAVFYQMWQMGEPIFTESIDTAAIQFDKSGKQIAFLWNKSFYDSLDYYNRKFVICHECLHVLLNHGSRFCEDKDLSNISMDLVINELLITKFGFERNKIKDWQSYCWFQTVFKNRRISKNKSHEYYYKMLSNRNIDLSLVDEHLFIDGFSSKDISYVFEQLNEQLTNEEKESLHRCLSGYDGSNDFEDEESFDEVEYDYASTEKGGILSVLSIDKVKPKRKWETVINEWSLRYAVDFVSREQWARIHRRLSLLPDDLFLPSEMEEEVRGDPDKIEVWFFQDTSGSCIHLANRFFRAALSLPSWRFDVKLFCFDTQVYKTDLESRRIYGSGGTSFSCIEEYIQRYCHTNKEQYPEAVFVITDGYGDNVHPQYTERWHWFLTNGYRRYIPSKCHVYNLRDFE